MTLSHRSTAHSHPSHDKKPVATKQPELRLRTSLNYDDLADELAHLVWAYFLCHPENLVLNGHGFPLFTRMLRDVLIQNVGPCPSIADIVFFDPWARIGGGAPTRNQKHPACADHEVRLLQETGTQVNWLVSELEHAAAKFLSQSAHAAHSKFTVEARRSVQKGVAEVVRPYLIKNLGSQCCANCVF